MQCIKCYKELEYVFERDRGYGEPSFGEPSEGLIFFGHGNYGSRVYDPTHSAPVLVIWVCDDCIRVHRDVVMTRDVKEAVRPEFIWAPFDPDAELD